MAYATVTDVQERMSRELSLDEVTICKRLLDDAAVIIDSYNSWASASAKEVVSCRMVIRSLGGGESQTIPIGATQGSMSALGYSQSWTVGSGSTGELYLEKLEKKLLGVGEKIGSRSPIEVIPDRTGWCCE